MKIIFQNVVRAKSSDQKILADFKKNPPDFSDLPKSDFSAISKFVAANKKWQQVLVIGIGGSSLPARTLVDALGKSKREFYFLENVDPTAAAKIFARLDFPKTIVLVVSKSGDTLETLANFFIVRKLLGKNWRQQVVFLTDAEKGFLRTLATKEKIVTFTIPAKVGGRFSIFSPVGLLPAALAGANLQKLLVGAQKADPKQTLEFAQIHAAEFRRGKNISVFCVYANALESLAKFFEQLLAESLGKNSQVGITPAAAVGALDQHSKLQLWRDGPADKFYIFVGAQNFKQDFRIPNPPPEFGFLKNRNLSEILRAEFLATTKSLSEKKRPLAIFDFAQIEEAELGEFLQFWMLEIYFLAQILGVNFADQPGVERGKILARARLGAN
ncbi:MAG: glucose-6-phosphate isomerase [Patescibacteria group bacterium]